MASVAAAEVEPKDRRWQWQNDMEQEVDEKSAPLARSECCGERGGGDGFGEKGEDAAPVNKTRR